MNKKDFPTLYKKTSTGKIQMWHVWVEDNVVYSESGQTDGKKILSTDTIKAGKNIGRSNETTPQEQANLEALSRWESKLKKGYVKTQAAAKADKVDDIIEGGYIMQLAHKYSEQSEKITFPCAVQPKLNGERCGTIQDTMWTRSRKIIQSVPHISEALTALKLPITKLDGELYNHLYKHNLEKIRKIVGQKKVVDPNHKVVEYHIYDYPSDETFRTRMHKIDELFKLIPTDSPLKKVETLIARDQEDISRIYKHFMSLGYEGVMVRNLDAPYEHKRSYNLLKLKEFDDAEFEIIDMIEGNGGYAGHVGAFVLKHGDKTFKAKMSGHKENSKLYWENKNKCIGKLLTVQYQGMTGANGIPQFPVGISIRDYYE